MALNFLCDVPFSCVLNFLKCEQKKPIKIRKGGF